MKINVRLVGFFQVERFKNKVCDYPEGVCAREIFDDLQLPPQHLGIILINGRHATSDTLLTDGDDLVLMPLLGGG